MPLLAPPSAAALKRWLETLSEKDGVKPAADAAVDPEPQISDVVPLGSRDLDLEELSAGPPRRSRHRRSRGHVLHGPHITIGPHSQDQCLRSRRRPAS